MKVSSAGFAFWAFSALLIAAGSAHAIDQPKLTQAASADQPVTFDVYIPIQKQAELDALLSDLQNSKSANYHRWLTPQQFHQRFAPDATKLKAAQEELSGNGFTVTQLTPRHLEVSGNAGAVEHAFFTQLSNGLTAEHTPMIAATRDLTLTPTLQSLNAVVTNFSTVRHSHSNAVRTAALPQNRYSTAGPYWFTDLKQAYDWPSFKVYSGTGTTIGILMSGGFNKADMNLYFGHEKLKTPNITQINVDGGAPFDPNNSFETHLDIQQAGGMAPNAHIILYNVPDLSQTEIERGLSKIIEDNKVDVVNMSFSIPELFFTAEYNSGTDFSSILRLQDDLFKQGNAQGITFVTGSGDLGALAAPPIACFDSHATSKCGRFRASAEFPAASPHVTGVGGTNLATTHNANNPADLNSAYIREEAFGDPLDVDIFFGTPATGGIWGSGGGNSIYFKKPSYQNFINTSSSVRSVPDVSLHMGGCPGGAHQPCNPADSADLVAIGGQFFGVIGTSASSPDFAGLVALTVERFHSRQGNANEYIYTLAAAQEATGLRIYRENTSGFNGAFFAHPGYDRVLGVGTVDGKNFLLAPKIPSAGIPQTATNP